MNIRLLRGLVLAVAATGLTISAAGTATAATTASSAAAVPYTSVVPAPLTAKQSGAGYSLGAGTVIAAGPGTSDVAVYLAGILRRSTGLPLPVVSGTTHRAGITLALSGAPSGSWSTGQVPPGPVGPATASASQWWPTGATGQVRPGTPTPPPVHFPEGGDGRGEIRMQGVFVLGNPGYA